MSVPATLHARTHTDAARLATTAVPLDVVHRPNLAVEWNTAPTRARNAVLSARAKPASTAVA